MDAQAILSRHGWRGVGYPLHPSGRGIKKPLLVSQKTNVLGVGKKKHDVHADQWWARAFDSGLKSLDIGIHKTAEIGSGEQTSSIGALEMARCGGAKWTGLYESFVKGECMNGTFSSKREHGAVAVTAREAGQVVVPRVPQPLKDKKKKRKKDKSDTRGLLDEGHSKKKKQKHISLSNSLDEASKYLSRPRSLVEVDLRVVAHKKSSKTNHGKKFVAAH